MERGTAMTVPQRALFGGAALARLPCFHDVLCAARVAAADARPRLICEARIWLNGGLRFLERTYASIFNSAGERIRAGVQPAAVILAGLAERASL